VIGGVIILLLLAVILTNNNNGTPGAAPTTVANHPADANKQLTVSSAEAPPGSSTDPPRMSLEAFKALYDDPAKRPLIIDVRAAESYAAGHITGSISFPESDVDARVAELPKDKLIVAYCQ
jgi:3-mercaptopyruvate sulfurtransferase SseA